MFEDLLAKPGIFQIQIEPDEWYLQSLQKEIFISEKGIRNLKIELVPSEDHPLILTSFSGEVFSSGGGKGLGWVEVYLISNGHQIYKAWTNDFGRYQIPPVFIPQGEVTLVFLSLAHAYFPEVVNWKVEDKRMNLVSVDLVPLHSSPVVRMTLQGEILNPITGRPQEADLKMKWQGFEVARRKAELGKFDWQLDLPQGSYTLDILHPSRLMALRNQPINIEEGSFISGEYQLQLSKWAILLGLVLLGVILVIIQRVWKYFRTVRRSTTEANKVKEE